MSSIMKNWNMYLKKMFVLLLIFPIILISMPGCNSSQGDSADSPAPPITVELSFPDGAPPLNQEAELVYIIEVMEPDCILENMSIEIRLPEGLELVSGDLSWFGDISSGDDLEVIRATVRAIQAGNWTIESRCALNPEKQCGISVVPGWHPAIYVSISEDSAEWGEYPPWYEGDGEVPIEIAEAPSTPIKVDLSISQAPAVNAVAKLTCTVSSIEDAPNTTAQIKLPEGASLVSGSLNWQGNLKAGEPVSFSAEIVFREAGKAAIEAAAWCAIDQKNSWGDIDVIYLTAGVDRGEFGWPPTGPVKVVQTEEGDVPGVPSSQEEPPVGELPPPPALLSDGTVEGEQEHHSITVTGTYKYWTEDGDYRDNPDKKVGADNFLVELVSESWEHKAYGYTNSQGYFSISGVDPSGGIRARLWCYINYSGNELRVVSSGSSLTGLDDVWHTYGTDVFNFPDDGQEHSIGTWTLPQGVEGDGAFWIKDDLTRAYRYARDRGHPPGPGTVRWTEDSTHGTHYHWGGQIHLKGEDERAPDVVLHEYGHNVMHNVYNGYRPPGDCPDEHNYWEEYNVGCAWREGWATFFALAANGNSEFTWPSSFSRDFETPNWGTSGWDNGDAVEGRVAGALWDLCDDNVDGYDGHYYDQFSDGFDEILETLCTQTDDTFEEFWDALKWEFPDQVAPARAIFQNTIVYDELRLYITVQSSPSSAGTVDKSPDLIYYPRYYSVTLTANANDGWTFYHWSGNLSGTINPRAILMDFDKTVTAHFLSQPPLPNYPTIQEEVLGGDTSGTTDHIYTLPSGISSGDLLIVVTTTRYNRAFTYPAGWTQLFQTGYSPYMRMGAAYRIADGTEGSTITVTSTPSDYHAYVIYRITDYSGTPEVSTMATGCSLTPNPPSLAPSWVANNTLWLALGGQDFGSHVNAYPTNYTDGDYWSGTSTSCAFIMEAYREYSALSEDPGNFSTGINSRWCAVSMAIRPTLDIPNVPTLNSPADGTTSVSVTPALVFNYSDPDNDDCTWFDLQVDDNSDFSSPEIDETEYASGGPWSSGSPITYSVSSSLSDDTQYYWKVRVFDGTYLSSWSDGSWDFTTRSPGDIQEAVLGGDISSTIDHIYTLPSGISSGDLLIVVTTTRYKRAFTYPAGWTQLFQTGYSPYMRMGAAYRIADGTEGSTITVTTDGGYYDLHAFATYRITGYSGIPEVSTMATGYSSTPNPPSLAPSWGEANTLWIALGGVDSGNKSVSTYPTYYVDGDCWSGTNISCAFIMEACRKYTTESEDPECFCTTVNTRWCAVLIAIRQ